MGIAYAAPIYFFIQYLELSPLTSLNEKRREVMVSKKELKTILPTIGLAYILPSVAMFAVPGLVNRQSINGIFSPAFSSLRICYSTNASRPLLIFGEQRGRRKRLRNRSSPRLRTLRCCIRNCISLPMDQVSEFNGRYILF